MASKNTIQQISDLFQVWLREAGLPGLGVGNDAQEYAEAIGAFYHESPPPAFHTIRIDDPGPAQYWESRRVMKPIELTACLGEFSVPMLQVQDRAGAQLRAAAIKELLVATLRNFVAEYRTSPASIVTRAKQSLPSEHLSELDQACLDVLQCELRAQKARIKKVNLLDQQDDPDSPMRSALLAGALNCGLPDDDQTFRGLKAFRACAEALSLLERKGGKALIEFLPGEFLRMLKSGTITAKDVEDYDFQEFRSTFQHVRARTLDQLVYDDYNGYLEWAKKRKLSPPSSLPMLFEWAHSRTTLHAHKHIRGYNSEGLKQVDCFVQDGFGNTAASMKTDYRWCVSWGLPRDENQSPTVIAIGHIPKYAYVGIYPAKVAINDKIVILEKRTDVGGILSFLRDVKGTDERPNCRLGVTWAKDDEAEAVLIPVVLTSKSISSFEELTIYGNGALEE
ncbi:hypothetical protein CC80DRAFT_543159 [Byssothecium circinans]|uniref:Uncharacterized protein n=1 Tax=Byssothecium circinans TaxID=147558 RepID=A0A6A5UDI6_9PLEO|nr:hypothetical protein CC80DRAFT_543159 [Byssothecium circinans]